MKICVLGGSGRMGTQVIKQALTRGRSVTTLVRHPENVSISHPHLTIVTGDATNPVDIITAASRANVIVHTVSVPLFHAKPTALYSRVTQAVIDAWSNIQASQYIVMSSTGTGHARKELPCPLSWGYELLLGDVADDKEQEEQLLAHSDLPWTIIKAVRLTDTDDTSYDTIDFSDYHTSLSHKISRKAVANAICDQIFTVSQNLSHKIVVY